ncbi:HNH endonuclease [Asticcacaulis sp. ZE23SCel15]|uniref:HNH endonuclease n=1 Tax=Asticcacaulis sp. ZE23SCel15 TaxID=3059027 RepID=UPI00265DEDD2|nr:HNH endonuclease [Asticcacaulis sp. ZE23SCel15]WKL57762.1 HNH endonuclease [Asticcacaulis sp. ZE23SCel15]
MIKLEKRPKPQILTDNEARWLKVLQDKMDAGETPTAYEKSRYRHPDVKSELLLETHEKCAYCESKFRHVHHGDVEHIYPKSLDVKKTFEWENLTLACEVCNQFKTNNDPNVESIIDPYEVNPEEHFVFLGGMIFANTQSGLATRAILRLHRAELVETRNERADRVMTIFLQILDVSLPINVRRALYEDLLLVEAAPSAQYAAMTRCIIKQVSIDLPEEITS